MKKHLLSILLTLTICLVLLPTMAIATVAPVITGNSVYRSSVTNATVKFMSDTDGTVYYQIAESATAPSTAELAAWTNAGEATAATTKSISFTDLTSGAKYVHLVVNATGGVSNVLTISMPQDYYYHEDFEAYPENTYVAQSGNPLTPISQQYGGTGNANQKVALVSDNKFLSLSSSSTASVQRIVLPSSGDAKTLILKGKVKPLSEAGAYHEAALFGIGDRKNGVLFVNGKICYADKADISNITYSFDQWYEIELDVNLLASKYDIKLGGTIVASNVAYNTTDPYVFLFAGHSTTAYFDDIELYITSVAAPAATPTAGFSLDGVDAMKLTGTTDRMQYSVDGGTDWFACAAGSTDLTGKIITESSDIKIKDLGDGTTCTASAVQTIDITKAVAPTLVPVQPSAIGGKGSVATTSAHEFSSNGSDWTDCSGAMTDLAAGDYIIRVKASGTALASDSLTITISAFTGAPEATPEAVIDYMNERLIGLTTGAAYTVNGVDKTADADGKLDIESVWLGTTLSIVRIGNGTTTTDSAVQSLVIPARPTLFGVSKSDCTTGANDDGKLIGVSSTMEYKVGSGSWTDGDGSEITGITGDTICIVRLKATVGSFASAESSFTIDTYSAPPAPSIGGSGYPMSYGLTARAAEHGSIGLSKTSASPYDTITLTIMPEQGYALEILTVTAKNGNEIVLTEAADGTCSFKMPASNVEVRATFIEDNTMLNFFADVSADAYYCDAVLWAAQEKITEGTSATTFSPDASCTRGQVVTFLWRVAGSPKATAVNPFTDVFEDAYYYDAVLWAVELGITNGIGDNFFSPNKKCSRGEVVTFLYRYAKVVSVAVLNPFVDVVDGAYYYDAVLWAAEQGIANGISDIIFAPADDCTRSQVVTFLYKYFN